MNYENELKVKQNLQDWRVHHKIFPYIVDLSHKVLEKKNLKNLLKDVLKWS